MLKTFTKLPFYFILLILASYTINAQCGNEIDVVICDMSSIDFDGDGNNDGIINLYSLYLDETGDTLDPGIWSIKQTLSLPLNENTGDVSLWEYQYSSASNLGNYTYVLTTNACGNVPAATINIELGSFSGVALPPSGTNDVNLEICEGVLDLYESLVSNESISAPHLNGIWTLENDPSNGIAQENLIDNLNYEWEFSINYQPGLPLIDNAIFEFKYSVPATDNCLAQETNVKISVVRQVFSGTQSDLMICESELKAGSYDTDVDLTDDIYLEGEDIEGFWSSDSADSTGEITNEFDSEVNLKNLYDQLIIDKGIRFGYQDFVFRYFVPQRSGVCDDENSYVLVTILEELRPFNQNSNNASFCLSDTESVNLFSLLEFTNESGLDFIYPDTSQFTTWNYKSGPEDSSSIVLEGSNFVFERGSPDEQLGQLISPGIYTFEYEVDSFINGPQLLADCASIDGYFSSDYNDFIQRSNTCVSNCQTEIAEVVIEILPFDYAGENNADLIEICETEESVILTSLLDQDPLKGTLATTGVWTDADGTIYNNNFSFPEIDADTNYVLNYNTTNAISGCLDESQLTFTIINEKSPGSTGESITADGVVKLCTDDLSVVLFDQLQNADPTGQWTGPAGYVSADHSGTFIFNDQTQEDIKEGEYIYTIQNDDFCTSVETTALTIQFVTPVELATTVTRSYCQNEGSIDLLTLLEVSAPKNGVFTDVDNTGALTGSVFDFSSLVFTGGIGEYNFTYTLDLAPCDNPTQNFVIQVLDGSEAPSAGTGPADPIRVCSDNLSIILFDQLGGTPSMSGIWTGDFGYNSNGDHQGLFVNGDASLPILGEGTYTYTVGGGICNAPVDTATVTIEIIEPIELGENVFNSFCKLDGGVNLYSLLDENTTASGQFTDTDATNTLSTDGFFDFSSLPGGVYNFLYSIPNEAPCDISSLNVEINVIEIPAITGAESEFCILDARKLEDIEAYYFLQSSIPGEPASRVDVGNENLNWYTSLQSDVPIIDNPKLLDSDIYYVANVDADGCESERFAVEVTILNVGEKSSDNTIECPLEFQDGVSADGNDINDTFLLNWKDVNYKIEDAFPNYKLEIYNRYGVIVYKGNSNTEEFDGNSNVSLSIGSDLPSGVYFYIFNPNFKNNAPIQGSFYLSK